MIICGGKILFDKDIKEEDVEQQIIQVFFKKQMIYLSEHLENDPDVDIEKADEDQWKRSISKFIVNSLLVLKTGKRIMARMLFHVILQLPICSPSISIRTGINGYRCCLIAW